MNPRLRSILIGIGLLTLVIIAIVLIPRGLSIYYQSRGGQHIDYLMRSVEGIQELVCEPLAETNQAAIEEVERGIEDLNRAARFNRRNAHTYYQLGKGYCLLGEPEDALESYQQYTELRPDNPLGYIGLGFAYEAVCLFQQKVTNESSICEDDIYQGLIQKAWQDYGLQIDDFLTNATSQFDQRKYIDSLLWYSLAYRVGVFQLDELSKSDTLKWAISAALADGSLPIELYHDLPIMVFDDPLRIDVEGMRWLISNPTWDLFYGDQVNKFPSIIEGVGTLFWNGRVVSIVQIANSGDYEFVVKGINSSPPPIILLLEDNFKPLGEIRLEKGDQSREEITFKTFLSKGLHLVSLNFMNNEVVDGTDRDAHIEFIRIEQLPNNE